MAQKTPYDTPIVKLALEKKIITSKQYDECKTLVKKSNKIGLEASIEEVLVKQGYISESQIEDLKMMLQFAEKGTIFGVYRLCDLLGSGGMGKVYRAVHEFMNREVALKIISTTYMRDKINAQRFFQEIRALSKLSHPNISTIYDAGKIRSRYYFTMELIEGPSLLDFVKNNKHLSEQESLRIIRATALALGYAHDNLIIHRDVKPENILLTKDGIPKLTDFGIVMHHDADHMTLTQEGYIVGSYYFVSPEQCMNDRKIDGRSDIYSLGATLYYAMTGQYPAPGKSPQEIINFLLSGKWRSPRMFNAKISRKSIRLLRKMMATKRERRFQSMGEVVKAIDRPSFEQRIMVFLVSLFIIGALIIAGIIIQKYIGLL